MKQKKLAWKRESAEQLRAGDYILHRSMFGHWLIHHRTDGRLLLKATTFEEAKAACQRHRDSQFDSIIERLDKEMGEK